MNEQYEWSDSGKRLLLALELMAQNNGGMARLADMIETEWIKSPYRTYNLYAEKAEGDKRDWEYHEVEFLKANYYEMLLNDIAKRLGRSLGSVNMKLRAMYLRRELERKCSNRGTWTIKETVFLKNNFPDMSAHALAKHFGKTQLQVERYIRKLQRRGDLSNKKLNYYSQSA